MTLERDRGDRGDRGGRRVPTLTEVISPPTTVDLLLDVPDDPQASAFAGLAGEVVSDPSAPSPGAEELTIPFTRTSIPSVSALLAAVEPTVEAQQAQQRLIEDIMLDLQAQVDARFEAKLREALVPLLARSAEAMLVETREQFSTLLRDMVAQAVAQGLARHRDPEPPR
jgi:hypothetical protein